MPQELGYGSGMTCWRRLRDWHEAGAWQRLHEVLLAKLHAAGLIDWSRSAADGRTCGRWAKYRYVVEQAIGLLHWFRRLRIRWEIRDDIHEAFMTIGCAIICWRRLKIHALC